MFDINIFKKTDKLNGAVVYVLQSQENKELVLKEFLNAMDSGLDPIFALHVILDKHNFKEEDFTDCDWAEILEKVKKYVII